uniref:Ankyrin repeat domain 46b n=1 Tax=Oncorhynchus mykiss TaxID=8022 RepID=A0A8C7U8Q2_ONCMY
MSYVFINDSSQTSVPLLQACIDGDLPFAKRLLETGCDPNIRDNRGRTGLHLAAARGNVDICWFLHKFGADLLATDYQGNTALHLCGHVDTIQFLVSNGLKIDICNHNGSTPLVLAKRRGVNKDAIRLLEGLEEQEVKGFNRGAHSKLETMQMAESESAMESHSLLNPNLQNSEGVLSSFRTTWQEFVEDLGFWRVSKHVAASRMFSSARRLDFCSVTCRTSVSFVGLIKLGISCLATEPLCQRQEVTPQT